MKLLSFVGTGVLRETTYCKDGFSLKTPIVQEALARKYGVEKIVLFTTEKARSTNYPAIAQRLPHHKVVMVPDGACEDDLWTIFSTVTGEVEEGDEVLIDITHGFRSLPFIAFLTAAYLREVKKATITGVVYGAFEAGDGETTPIFDLAPFIGILDWTGGVRSFLSHVDAGEISRLVRGVTEKVYRSQSTEGPVVLNKFVNRLDSFTSAVRLTRPVEAVTLAGSILDDLPRVEEEVSRFTPALQPVISQIVGLSRFKSTDPFSPTGPDRDFISKQRALIDFQEEQGLFMQAISLAREWMVTVLLVSAGDGAKWLESEIRQEGALTFGGAEYKIRNNPYQRSRYSDWFESLPVWRECTSIWMETSRLRNSIDHCGMDPGSVKQRSKNLEENVHKALRKMKYFESLMLDKLPKK